MPDIRITLLGVPHIERDGAAIQVDTRKASALVANLAMSYGPQSRATIASLLWGDLDTSGARAALRRTLSTLKAVLPHSALDSDRSVIRFHRETLALDVDRFRAAVAGVRQSMVHWKSAV